MEHSLTALCLCQSGTDGEGHFQSKLVGPADLGEDHSQQELSSIAYGGKQDELRGLVGFSALGMQDKLRGPVDRGEETTQTKLACPVNKVTVPGSLDRPAQFSEFVAQAADAFHQAILAEGQPMCAFWRAWHGVARSSGGRCRDLLPIPSLKAWPDEGDGSAASSRPALLVPANACVLSANILWADFKIDRLPPCGSCRPTAAQACTQRFLAERTLRHFHQLHEVDQGAFVNWHGAFSSFVSQEGLRALSDRSRRYARSCRNLRFFGQHTRGLESALGGPRCNFPE